MSTDRARGLRSPRLISSSLLLWSVAGSGLATLAITGCDSGGAKNQGIPPMAPITGAPNGVVGGAGTGIPGGTPIGASGTPATPTNVGKGSAGAPMTTGMMMTAAAGQGAGGAMGNAGATAVDDSHDHCVNGEPADPGDQLLQSAKPEYWTSPSNGDIDLVVPKPVLQWMHDRVWEPSHDAWHNIRRCKSGGLLGGIPGFGGGTGSTTDICSHTELVPQHQECSDAEDGYEFLVMHRHMMQALRHAFPTHTDLFAGFPHFPFNATDVPMEWQNRWGTGWSQQIIDTANTLEAIEKNLAQFPTEGDLGKFIQCGGMAGGASSIHGALHFKWVVNDSPYSLGKQTVNIDNYMFWKLHGWIDEIWERYRVATGVTDDEPKLVEALIDQCRQMHALGHIVSPMAVSTTPLPTEHGEFHEKVRPILEKNCASCHSEASPEAGMSLGGHISSADIVTGLVNVQAMHGGQFIRVVANDPDHSWFYLKPAGKAMSAGCTGASCNAQVMPPTGQVTLSTADLDTIRQWITDGAPAPTQ